jgi:multidrug efflux pump subunit AcrA (membrane-fusion protein)
MVFVLSGLWLVSLPSLTKAAETVTISNCTLAPDEEAQVPAQEAGVLTKILVREGDQATAEQLLAQIDDIIPRAQRDVQAFKLDVAKKQAEDDIDKRFAEASAKVAEAEYDQAIEANKKIEQAVPQAEVRRRLLEWHKMVLSIEKAKKDLAVAELQAKVAQAELNAAKANVERRRVIAPSWFDRAGRPLDSVVVELSRHVGEWVQSGEPVLRLVRIDRLRVDGVLDAKEYRPSEIQDRPVLISVTLPRAGHRTLADRNPTLGDQNQTLADKVVTFPGKIVYVKPVIEGGVFQVRAEVENGKQDGVWVLNPGMNVKMTIELK